MRIIYVAIAACVSLGLGVAGTAAMTPMQAEPAKQARRATGPLLPLSEADLTSTRQMGCTCTFDSGNRTLVQAIGNELMVRTRAGRQVCRLTDARFTEIAGGAGTYRCGGVSMTLRQTGRRVSNPEADSSSGPSRLTLVQGRARHVVNGTFGCAC
jgi:hypothetical protein